MTTTPPPENPSAADLSAEQRHPETSPASPESPESPSSQYPALPAAPPTPSLPPEAYPTYSGGSGYDYGRFGAPPVRRRNGMGVAALVLGIVGVLIGPCSVLAIVFGRIGLNRVARGEATNRGVAQAGFVLGVVTLGLWVLGLVLLARR